MILKAIIKKLPDYEDNHYIVRIPFFEDNTKTEAEFSALLSYTPGIYGNYNVGDVVFVSFENEKFNIPIILGKMYVPSDLTKDGIGYGNFNILKADDFSINNNTDILDLTYIVLEEW